jgi:lipopolysaccharide export system protein LptC
VKAYRASLLPLVLVALLAGLTYWLDRVVETNGGKRTSVRHDPDYFVDRFTVRRFGTDGKLQHTVTADRMLHYPDNDTTEVTHPHLVYETPPRTDITARTAWLDNKGRQIKLEQDVRVARDGRGDQLASVLTTSLLYVLPDDETAHTDAPVTITQGMSVINGVGLEADNKAKTAVLQGPVHGTVYRKEEK